MASILLVDDDQIFSKTMAKVLTLHGHQVVEASDGVEALEECRKWVPDLLICDVYMPNMDGFRLLRELRNASISPKTLMVSGGSFLEKGEVLTLADGLGVEAVLEKPFELDELLAKVGEILG